MDEDIAEVLRGSIGHFWEQEGNLAPDDHKALSGFVRLNSDDVVELKVLDEEELAPSVLEHPAVSPGTWIVGVTEAGGVVIPTISGLGHRRNWGGSKASFRQYRAHALLTKVNVRQLRGVLLLEASAYFDDGLSWAGLSAIAEADEFDAQGRWRKVTYTLTSREGDTAAGSAGSIRIDLAEYWKVNDNDSSKTLKTALEVKASASRPRQLSELIDCLLAVQDLLGLAFDRFTPASGARAVPMGYPLDGGDRPHLWHRGLMVVPPSAAAASEPVDARPLFWLDDLGGPPAIGRWIRASRRFPTAISSLTQMHRGGASTIAGRLQQVAAAIEYYVNMCRLDRNAQWAQHVRSKAHAELLAGRVGGPFVQLVGDTHVWAGRLVDAYNGLKHDPRYQPDATELRLLAWSADVLLMCALLDRVAGSKAPSRRVLSDYRIEQGGEEVRSSLGTS